MSIQISPSILSADFAKLGEEIQSLEAAGADYIHFDVMDGAFVPNITIGWSVIKSLRPLTKVPFDVHLMIQNPDQYIDKFVQAGADIITIHAEACIHLDRIVEKIKSYTSLQGNPMQVGVSIVPTTHENTLQYILPKLDFVLVMSVNPGFGNQKFLPSQIQKIKNISKMIEDQNLHTKISVDGGINDETGKIVTQVGANILVAGNYIFSDNYQSQINKLKNCKPSI